MTRLYGKEHRGIQDEFGTRDMADRVEQLVCRTEFDDEAKGFIEHVDMFFLSSVDHQGRPTVSYKGCDGGFVKVLDSTTLAFPSYDGNGMFLSMGNIQGNAKIGMLFIDFENPHRVRVHGDASIEIDDELLAEYPGSEMIVRVKISEVFINCPRYIHRMNKLDTSKYVPKEGEETPAAQWKRIDALQDALPACDLHIAESLGGVITPEEYGAMVFEGKG